MSIQCLTLFLIPRKRREKALANLMNDEHHLFARKCAQESAVLLKNNGVLPLDSTKKTAFIGDFLYNPRYQGAGSSIVNPTRP